MTDRPEHYTERDISAFAQSHGIEVITRPTVTDWLINGDERYIVAAARESTSKNPGVFSLDDKARALLDDFIRLRHSGPFTHVHMSFRILAPLYVWTHVDQHAALKTSKTSARYRTLKPLFIVPPFGRPLKPLPESTAMRPAYGHLSADDYGAMLVRRVKRYAAAYEAYQEELYHTNKESAREVLPMATVTSGVVTGSLLEWMRAISVRVAAGNERETYPQAETEEVFAAILSRMYAHFPNVAEAFERYGLRTP